MLLGSPLAHTLSPRIHAAAFRAWGVDATYGAREIDLPEVESAVRRAAASGGGNVTLPYKREVAALLDERTADVEATGACNCFWGEPDGTIAGDNTDVGGFISALGEIGVDPAGRRVLLLGAGGAARAVVRALEILGSGPIDVWNRTPSRARALAADPGGRVEVLAAPPAGGVDGGYGLVVNATSLGLREDDPLPLDPGVIDATAAFDLVYAPGGTAWVRRASRLGIPAADGLGMLVHQAALSLRRWFPGLEPPLEAMRAAARGPAL